MRNATNDESSEYDPEHQVACTSELSSKDPKSCL